MIGRIWSGLRSAIGLAGTPADDLPEVGDQLVAGPSGGEISGRISELIGDYDPHHLTYKRMLQMRQDADVAFATAMVRAPILNRQLTVEGDDPEVVAYAQAQLDSQGRRFGKILSNAQPFGYKVGEIVWKTGPYTFKVASKDGKQVDWKTLPNAWTWERVKSICGESLTLLADEVSGEFLGVRQTGTGTTDKVCGPEQLALWSFRKEDVDDHLRGFSLLGQAYTHWWSKHANRISRDAFLKRDASPLPIGRTSTEQVRDEKGVLRDGYAQMRRILNARQAGAFVILSNKKDDKSGNYLQDIEYRETGGSAGAVYQAVCDKEGIQILRSFGITDEVGTSQSTGSRSRSETHQDTFLDTVQGWTDDYVDDTLLQKLKQNCEFNYGKERVERAHLKIRTAGISAGLKDTLTEVLGKVMDGEATIMGGGKILLRNRIDAAGICKSLNVPLLPEDEVEPDPPADPAGDPNNPDAPISPADEEAATRELKRRGALSAEDDEHGGLRLGRENLGEIRTMVRQELAASKPEPAPVAAAPTVNVTIAEGAVRVDNAPPAVTVEAPVTIEKGAVIVDNAPPEVTVNAGDVHVDAPISLSPEIAIDARLELKPGEKKKVEFTRDGEGKIVKAEIEPEGSGK